MLTPASSSACRLISSMERTAILNTSLPFMVIVCSLLRTVSGQGRLERSAGGNVELLNVGTVGAQLGAQDTGTVFGRAQHHRAGGVAKQNAGATILAS